MLPQRLFPYISSVMMPRRSGDESRKINDWWCWPYAFYAETLGFEFGSEGQATYDIIYNGYYSYVSC